MRISILGLAITLAFSCSVPESNPPQELMDVPYLVFSPEIKNELVDAEKSKILNMYSLSHYDTLRRSIAIKYY